MCPLPVLDILLASGNWGVWLCDYHVSVRSSPRTQGGTVPDQMRMTTERLSYRLARILPLLLC